MEAWAALLGAVATQQRPVILALHPGTRAAADAAGIVLSPHVRVIEPQGYRTTLGLQLHAAAVLTDSGGVQREAAWLRVPCLILRGTTEWVEALAGSEGRMVVVGLDVDRACAELDRLAPLSTSEADARTRAAGVRIETAGAVEAIVAAIGRACD
jgi:UDP-GlcNAc3NAcA epimerase